MITIKEAEEILKKEYHIDNFKFIVDNILLPDFISDEHNVVFNNSIFSSVKQLGASKKCDLAVYEVILEAGAQNRRVAITQEMFRVLRGLGVNNALVSFANSDYQNYRLSLLTSKYEVDGDKILKTLSNPRRYSYSLGYGTKTKTAYDFLIGKGKVNNLEELINRFSVEVVNKQFYNEIAIAFTKLVGGQRDGRQYEKQLDLYGVKDKNKCAEFAVRLIGRIVFCWFLKEKKSDAGIPLIPDGFLSLDSIKNSGEYYHDVLEPLFFELLNTNISRRKGKFAKEEIYNQIPYLNGGLFAPHIDDHYKFSPELDAGQYGTVTISNEWFEQFFSLLEQYNFTVDENTSYDIELSIDPEMLGRIFENLLAEINPETGDNAKKSTGSFYTPRDIVDYMVDNSIFEHLKNKTGIQVDKLKALISYNKEDDGIAVFDNNEKKAIINALYTVTVLDPACGSGAFPIGMLQKIVYILQEIDPTANLWFDKATENISFLMKKEFEKKFNSGSLDYIRKLTVIQNSIFGVDIQPIAVEIARLRCFLSLVIEEKVYDDEFNRGINPLPNLDFKFIIANTLLNLPHDSNFENVDSSQMSLFESQDHISQLRDVIEEYFSANDTESKNELKVTFGEIQKEMFQATLSNGKHASLQYEALSQWSPFSNKLTAWFDPEWMFGVKGGFDIVIGNPPYFLYQASHKNEIDELRRIVELRSAFGGKLNAYKLFLAKALHSLTKQDGIVCYIFQNSFLADKQASELRKDIFKNYQILKIDSFPERDSVRKRVFETVKMSVCIAMFSRTKFDKPFTINIWDDKYKSSGIQTTYRKEDIYSIDPEFFSIPRLKQEFLPLVVKINNVKKSFHMKCYEGELNMTVHRPFFTKDKTQPKVLKGASIQRYYWTENMSQGEIEYVDEEKYLSKFQKSAKSMHHSYERIGMQGMTGANDKIRIVSTIVPAGVYLANSCNYILPDGKNIYYLLGVFNSKLINWYFKCFSTNSNVNGYEVDNLPIPVTTEEHSNEIALIVKQILELKSIENNSNVSDLETQIDRLVYNLYDLSNDEISIIESI